MPESVEQAQTTMWQALQAWYEGRPGSWLSAAERQLLQMLLPDLFGYHLLQLGIPDDQDWLSGSRINHHILLDVGESLTNGMAGLCAEADRLPLASESVDVAVLPHTLDFHSRPHEILREIDRVLIPEGHAVILAFNPLSLWGLTRVLLGWRGRMPWRGQYYTQTRMRDWLALLGFDCIQVDSLFFRPPFKHEKTMQKLEFMERFGRRCCPFASAVYVITARKRTSTLTPIKPRWRTHREVIGGVVEPSTRQLHRERLHRNG
jgi:SAM-dependent methyltransferase